MRGADSIPQLFLLDSTQDQSSISLAHPIWILTNL